jgi:hypothetical protein
VLAILYLSFMKTKYITGAEPMIEQEVKLERCNILQDGITKLRRAPFKENNKKGS